MNQTLSEKLIAKTLAKLPEFRDCRIVHMGEGVSTEVYRLEGLKTVYYLRLKDSGDSASAEVLAHNLMLQQGARVPKVVYTKDFDSDLGRSFLITSEIPGSSARSASDNIDGVLYDAGRDLALINSVKLEKFGWIDATKVYASVSAGDAEDYFSHMTKHVAGMFAELVADGVFSDALRVTYLKWFAGYSKILVGIKQPVLAHGDFDLSHIYQKDGVYTGIIDFGDIRAVSIFHDLAHFYLYVPEKFDLLLAGYQSLVLLPKDYMDYIQLEASILGIGKLWWMSKNTPNFASQVEERKRPVLVILEKVLRTSLP